jgi:hypothetical protein
MGGSMTQRGDEETVRRTLTVGVPTDRAFTTFVEEFANWWPPEYTWGQEALETIGIEGREGGRCFERGPHGFHNDWGRVLAYEPPTEGREGGGRLLISWQVSPMREPVPDPERASEVEVRFEEEGPSSTRVEFEHRSFSRHGPGGEEYLEAMSSPDWGWTYILDRYAANLTLA